VPEEAPKVGAKQVWLVIGRCGLGLDYEDTAWEAVHGRLAAGQRDIAQPLFFVHLSYDFCLWVYFGAA
jgi:hypothetical protein